MLRGLSAQFVMTRYVVRDITKKHHEAGAMLVEKEAKLASGHFRVAAKQKSDKGLVHKYNGFTGTCY